MKKNFLTGLAILLPIALTAWILFFLMNFLTNPFMGLVKGILNTYHFWGHSLSHETVLLISRLALLVTLFLITLLIGFFARMFFIRALFRWADKIFHHIPVFNKVYKASKEVVHTLFNDQKKSFSQVVLVPFPHAQSYCLGMITSQLPSESDPEHQEKISVFIPGTPNPTVGFMILYQRHQLILLNIRVDEALKFIMSMGSLPFSLNIPQHLSDPQHDKHSLPTS
jgi:uncharacterized membrane protein